MSDKTPTDLINRFYEEMLAERFDYALDAADPAYHSLTEISEIDPQSLRASCAAIADDIVDLKRRVFKEFNNGNEGVVLHEYTGRSKATGKIVRLRSADYYEVRAGKLLVHWGALQFEEPAEDQ
ncbi:nuclear transport factor 2 family protein [Emcibacter nanhaiensis]|uniref:SnoaL-like domain-containing protein n=1 Tax=Emcibacter nanhaiensis TaxID=1505037 RepID=A0A501P9W4_9PROT|nr:hypothetical protein [Emcibacter nanhaiensis]TPD56852.1 hypothetical protein FIV46_17945 [Emcibacter nanhaiensis]